MHYHKKILGPDGSPYDPEAPIIVPSNVEVGGFFKWKKFCKFSGKVNASGEFQHNLISDEGLNKWGEASSFFLNGVKAGADNTPPSTSNSDIGSYLGVTDQTPISENSSVAQDGADWYSYNNVTYRFPAGVATGVIAELAYTYNRNSGDGNFNFSRELVRDGVGDPTTINKGASEILDVTWELRGYQNPNDVVVTNVPIGAGTHTITSRPSQVDLLEGRINYPMGPYTRTSSSSADFGAFTGAIGGITDLPAGSVDGSSSKSWSAYIADSFYIDCGHFFSVDDANFNILSVTYLTNVGRWQVGFDPFIPKTSDFELNLIHRLSWARRP